MLSLNGMLNGLTASLVVVFATVFSIIFMIKAIKMDTKILKYGALMGLFAGLLWIGPMCDFISLFLTDNHIDNSYQQYGILSYMWVAPSLFCSIYVGAETMITDQKRKKMILIIYGILGVLFEVVLFTTSDSTFTFMVIEGDLIDAQFVYFSPAFILIAFFLISVVWLGGIGTLRKAIKSTGNVRKNFLYLSLALNLFVVVAVFDAFLPAGVMGMLYIVRFGMVICAWSMYIALKN